MHIFKPLLDDINFIIYLCRGNPVVQGVRQFKIFDFIFSENKVIMTIIYFYMSHKIIGFF